MKIIKGLFFAFINCYLVIIITMGPFFFADKIMMVDVPDILKTLSVFSFYAGIGMALYTTKFQLEDGSSFFKGWVLSFKTVFGFLKLFINR